MTMPSSGPLNMAVTITPQSVANELGFGLTTAISMNTAAVRVLAGAGASGSAWSLSSMYGKINNWILDVSTGQRAGYPVAINTSQNGIYVSGFFSEGVQKINVNSGASIWFSQLSFSLSGAGTVVDSSGSLWLGQFGGVAKLDAATGSVTINASITVSTDFVYRHRSIATAGSYIYLYGFRQPTAFPVYSTVSKYDLTGAQQWSKMWLSDSPDTSVFAVDASGNSYSWGYADNGAGSTQPSLLKLNTSGTLQWQTIFNLGSPPGSGGASWAIGVDASSNVFIGAVSGSSSKLYFAKFNSAGVLQWQKEISNALYPNFNAPLITLDSTGNCYLTSAAQGSAGLSTSWEVGVFKFDTSGTLLWQRLLAQTSPAGVLSNISLSTDNVGNLYVGFATLRIKVPVDGSKTGSFTVNGKTISYASSGFSVANTAFTTTAGTISTTSYTPTITSQSTATTITTGSTTVTTI